MNDFFNKIPPQTEEECLEPELQGLLEIEVIHLSFITSSSSSFSSANKKYPCSVVTKKKKKEISCALGNKLCDKSCENIDLNKDLSCANKKNSSLKFQHSEEKKVKPKFVDNLFNHHNNNYNNINCVQVKIVWFGERKEDAANLCISCESQQQQQRPTTLDYKLDKNKRKSHHIRKQKHKRLLLQSSPLPSKSDNNTLRYRVCTRKSLFLDYLRSCKPIQIIVSSSSNCQCFTEPLGQAQIRLPQVLLRKFEFNIGKGHNFEHKTKIYALYQKEFKQSCKDYPPDNNFQPDTSVKQKSGEIQLRFRMLFAPSAALTATAASSASLATKRHTINVLHDQRLTSSPMQHHHHHNCHLRHHPHMGNHLAKVAEHVLVQGEKSKRLSTQSKAEEIVEAMKKLDAKLVAYLAGETDIAAKVNNCEYENTVNFNLDKTFSNTESSYCNNSGVFTHLDDLSPATKLNIFKNIKGIKIEMEALTLQSEGTKYINLLQKEIRPIFTVECQLSNELIKKVPLTDMFHIMQFESEKFHSLTQCTRFGQEAERCVQLDVDENGNTHEMNLGRIYLTVWWREPGTCLNEMLGMGVFEISDLFNASLLEQCRRIDIKRRSSQLACLYFKIILQRDVKMNAAAEVNREIFLPKQSSCDSGDEKSPKSADKPQSSSNAQSQQQQQQQLNEKTQCVASGNISTDKKEKASAENNNSKLKTTNFDDETTKIRLLKGLVHVNEARFVEKVFSGQEKQKFLICRRFWLDEPVAAKADELNQFNYQEQFSVINDEKFLQRAEKQFLHLEIWYRLAFDDGNGNLNYKILPVGLVNIPLHQFYIAYRDAAITNHLCKGKLPVISIDAWAPIVNCETGLKIGDIKCLLAVGSEEQIENLKECRGLNESLCPEDSKDLFKKEELQNLKPLQIAIASKDIKASTSQSCAAKSNQAVSKIKKTSDLLDMLQKVLMSSPSAGISETTTSSANAYQSSGNEKATAGGSSALKPLQPSNIKLFKISLEIQRALGLPLNPAVKAKKASKQRNSSKRFPPNEPPSTYVTFQADEGQYQTYKSHEGLVFATNIAEKNTQPHWQQRFRLGVTVDYLKNPQKRFILKVWKKSALDMTQGLNQPTPMEDAILGFAALDLSVFTRGLHIGGRFNIVDFNGRINGQLEIRCQPLDDIPATNSISPASLTYQLAAAETNAEAIAPSSVDSVIDQFEQTLDLTHLNLGQAIKRKFTELEGISDRLRARLGDVTGIEMSNSFDMEQFDNWQPLEKELCGDDNNDVMDEFERDLNTPNNEEENESEKNETKGNSGSGSGMTTSE